MLTRCGPCWPNAPWAIAKRLKRSIAVFRRVCTGSPWCLLGRQDLAEEVLQEAFVRIWYNASRYEAHLAAPMTWMINITRNLAIDQLRKRREQPLADGQQDALLDEGPSAYERLDSEREARALNRCLDTLDGMQRQSITVAYFQGLSCSELAEHLAAPLGSVKSWIRRGMERLRRCLES